MTEALSHGAWAADTDASGEAVQEVVVTGSRIKDPDAASASPITVVDAAAIQQTESITVEQILRKTPSVDFNGGETSNSNNGGGGESQASLRNLGPQRTLVLVNGVRFPFTDNQGNESFDAVDLNNIPITMIDHIDVLRDGASSIYGADAIGGVINIITKQHFNGVEVGGSFGETSYGDGLRHQEYSNLGYTFDRGSFLLNISEDSTDPILGSARAWSTTQHPEADYNYYNNLSSRVTGAVGLINGVNWYFPHGFGSAIKAADAYTLGFPLDYKDIGYGGGGITPGDIALPGVGVYFNTLPNAGITAGLKRKQANFTGNFEIAPDITANLEAFYTYRQSSEQLNPEPTGYNTTTPQFPAGLMSPAYLPDGTLNPYNPTNQPGALALYGVQNANVPILTRRFEGGPRLYTDEISTFRMRAGISGTLLDRYDWELGQSYGRSEATFNTSEEVNFYHLSQELGMNSCGTAPGCSVANFFGYNTLTPAQANYLYFTNTDHSTIDQEITYANIAGPVYDLPAGQVKSALGFEYRTDSISDNPSAVVAQGDAAVYALPTSGGYHTYSGYAEVQVPVLKDVPFVKSLNLDVSSRYDFNDKFGRSLTYKTGINYAIDNDFRLRGGRSTGFRAPQPKELYAGNSYGEVGGQDPCASGGAYFGNAACTAALAAAGVSSTTQVNQITEAAGGNPALKPEVSQEWTMGGVYTPEELQNFSFSVDFYTVFIRNEIGSLDPNQVLSACYGGTAYLVSQAQACKLVGPRIVGTGALAAILAPNQNIGAENTDGIDMQMTYAFNTSDVGLDDGGHISILGQANFLLSDNLLNAGVIVPLAGTYGGGSSTDNVEPRWKAQLGITYSQPNWSFNWTTHYYGGVRNSDDTSACEYGSVPCPAKGALDFEGNEAAGVFYHDISATYKYDTVSVSVGVDNLFDKDPPFLYPTGQGNNGAAGGGYDFVGRFVYMRASVKFEIPKTTPAEPAPAPLPPAPAYAPPPAAAAPSELKIRNYQVFFDFDKFEITTAAKKVVADAAQAVKSGGIARIDVIGHTDTVGSASYNLELSVKRAEAVKSELEADGVSGPEIVASGAGKTGLLVPTGDGVREAQNRRAEIHLE